METRYQRLRDAIETEGFEYAFLHYSDFRETEDKKLFELIDGFRKAYRALLDYTRDNLGIEP